MSTVYDGHLQKLLTAHTAKLGKAGEVRLAATMFSFLRRHTSLFTTSDSVSKLHNMIEEQRDLTLKEQTTTQEKVDQLIAETKNKQNESVESVALPCSNISQEEMDFRAKEMALLALTRPPPPPADDEGSSEEEEYEVPCPHPSPNDQNGGSGSNYNWAQSPDDVTIDVIVDEKATSKSLDVDLSDDHRVTVILSGVEIINAELSHPVDTRAFSWTLEDSDKKDGTKHVSLYFNKSQKMSWWDSAFKGHSKINLDKIVAPEGKLDALDHETRRMVEKMMFDQRQKAQGKPTAEQIERMAAFEKFKKMHPEMDFSEADITY